MNLSISVKYGLIAGIGTIGYMLIFYLVDPRLMLNSWVMWASLVIYLAAMIMACRRKREDLAFDFPLPVALRTAFAVYALASLIYYTFYYILFNFIDPGLVDIQKELVLENLDSLSGVMGEVDPDELREQYEKEDFQVTFLNTAFGFAQSLIGGFIFSLAIAGIMTRRRERKGDRETMRQ